MNKTKSTIRNGNYRIPAMAILVGICCLLAYYFHWVLRIEIVFSHFFYVPIILAAVWWKRKGLVVPLFLALMLLVSHPPSRFGLDWSFANDLMRAAVLIVVGVTVSILIERMDKSDIRLMQHAESLERMVEERTKELRETRDHLDNLIRYANAPIIVWNPANEISIFNQAFEKLSGRTEADMIGQPLDMLFPEDSRADCLHKVEIASKGEYWETVEIPILRRDGEILIGLWNSANIYSEDGKTLLATVAQGQDITERVRSEETLRALNATAATVQRAARTPKAVFTAVMEQLHVVGLAGAVALLDETRERFTIRYTAITSQVLAQTEKLVGFKAKGYILPVEQLSISGQILAGETVFVPDVAALMAPIVSAPVRPLMPSAMRLLEMPRGVIAPLSVEGEIIGFLGVSADRMTETDVPVVTAFANQMAAALENAHLFQAEQRGREVAEALQETGRVVNASLDLDNVLPLILEQLAQVIQYDSSAVLLFSDGCLEMRAGRGFPDIEAALRLSFAADEDNLPSAVTRSRRPLVIGDVKNDPRWQPHSGVTHIRGWIGTPLIVQDRVVGVLTVDSRQPETYSQEDGQLVFAFAGQAAVAIQNAQLYEQAQQEIAERVRAERELEERRVYLEGVLGATPNAIVTLDKNHLIVYWNPGAEILFGYSPEEVTGKNIDHLITNPDTYKNATEITQIVLGGKKISPIEAIRYRKNGSSVDVIVAASPILVGDELIGVVAVYIDITAHKQTENMIKRLKEFNEGIVQSMAEGIVVEDAEGYITFINPAATASLGYAPDELVGQHWTAIIPPDQRSIVQAADERRARGEADRYELEQVRKDGSRLSVLVSGSPRFEKGQLTGSMAVFTDITERKRAEEQIQRSYRELALLNRVIAAASTTLDPKAVLETTCRELALAFGLPQAAAALLNEERTASLVVAEYLAEGRSSALDVAIPVEGNFVTQYVVENKTPLAIADAQHDPRMAAIHEVMRQRGTVSLLILPLMMRGQVVGTLGLDAVERREFSSEEIDLAANAVAAAAQALENARLFDEIVARNAELRRLSQAIEQAAEAVVITDLQGEIEYVNPAFEHITGFSQDEALGQNLRILKSGEHGEAFFREMWQTILAGEVWRGSLTNRRKSGELYHEEMHIAPVLDESGTITNFVAIKHDVTEQVKAEAEFRESEKRYRLFAENMSDIIWTMDMNLKYTYISPSAIRMAGYSVEEAMTLTLGDVLTPTSLEVALKTFAAEMAGEKMGQKDPFRSMTMELEQYCKDGSTIWTEVKITGLRGQDDQLVELLGVSRDITERVRAEAALRESEQKYRIMIEQSNDMIWTLDTDGNLTFFNQRSEELSGHRFDDWRGKSFAPLIGEKDLPRLINVFHRTLKGEPQQYEIGVKKYDGGILDLSVNTAPILKADQVIGTVSFGRDITKRKQAEEKIQRQLVFLRALHTIDKVISSSTDMNLTVNMVLEQVLIQLGVDAAAVLLFDPVLQVLEYTAGKGFLTAAHTHTILRLDEGCAGRAAIKRRTISIPDLGAPTVDFPKSTIIDLQTKGFSAYYAVPLIAKGMLKGVLEIFHRTPLSTDNEWMGFLDILAGQIAIAIDNATLFNDLERSNLELALAYDTTLEGWATALELHDQETEGHSRRVTEMTLRLARVMGVGKDELGHVRRGALLHDIGKMGIPDSILQKPGPLDDQEWVIMKKHPVYARDMLASIAYLRPALDIPYCHHEKWDGSGYPQGLRGEEIPLAARIFAIVDVWDAFLSDRPYRDAWPEDKVVEYIREQSGAYFDPQVVEAFLTMIGKSTRS